MAGLVPATHVLPTSERLKDVDARLKAEHDGRSDDVDARPGAGYDGEKRRRGSGLEPGMTGGCRFRAVPRGVVADAGVAAISTRAYHAEED